LVVADAQRRRERHCHSSLAWREEVWPCARAETRRAEWPRSAAKVCGRPMAARCFDPRAVVGPRTHAATAVPTIEAAARMPRAPRAQCSPRHRDQAAAAHLDALPHRVRPRGFPRQADTATQRAVQRRVTMLGPQELRGNEVQRPLATGAARRWDCARYRVARRRAPDRHCGEYRLELRERPRLEASRAGPPDQSRAGHGRFRPRRASRPCHGEPR
jgi:hypothetical protein